MCSSDLWRRELDGAGSGAEDSVSAPMAPEPAAYQANTARQYMCVSTEPELDEWFGKIRAACLTALDTETTSLDPFRARLVGISLAVTPGEAAYIPLGHVYPGAPDQLPLEMVLAKLKPWLEDASAAKLGQNIKYDTHVFANHGVTLRGVVHDTLLESYVLESHMRHDMDDLAGRHLLLKTITYDEVTGKGASRIGFEQVAVERATEYAAEDADITLQLHHALFPRVQALAPSLAIYRDIEMPVMQVLQTMERVGVLLDTALLADLSREFGSKMIEAEARAHAQAQQPFNLNSPKQIQEILFDKQGLKPVKIGRAHV